MRYFHDVNSIIKKILKDLIWYKGFEKILTFDTLNCGRTGIFSMFIGITFERNKIFSWCKFHNKEEIKGFNLIYSLKKFIDIWYPKSWQDSIFGIRSIRPQVVSAQVVVAPSRFGPTINITL